MQHLPDREILDLLKSGDPAQQKTAFRYLYHQYQGLAESLVTKNSGSPEEAKDVFQDALIVLFNNAKKEGFQLTSALKTYLYSICHKLWLMKLRKTKRETPLETHHELLPVAATQLETLINTERKMLITQLLEKLGDDCRRIIELFYFRKTRMSKIKEIFGLGSEQAAKNKKSQCMKQLRQMALANREIENLRN